MYIHCNHPKISPYCIKVCFLCFLILSTVNPCLSPVHHKLLLLHSSVSIRRMLIVNILRALLQLTGINQYQNISCGWLATVKYQHRAHDFFKRTLFKLIIWLFLVPLGFVDMSSHKRDCLPSHELPWYVHQNSFPTNSETFKFPRKRLL